MDNSEHASESLRHLKNELDKIADLSLLLEVLPITLEEQTQMPTDCNLKERIEYYLNLKLGEGEPDCQQCLSYLEERASEVPELAQVLWGQRKPLDELLLQLNLGNHKRSKLSLQQILCIGEEVLRGFSISEDEPQQFLRKLLTLDESARYTRPGGRPNIHSSDPDLYLSFQSNSEDIISIHPLDVLCAFLHCSDNSLQQQILLKMTTCQFAVPLLLPAGDGKTYTLMLWAMRDIVKMWTPHSLISIRGFREENLVDIPMPTFSFMRLGKCNVSKSKLLNAVLTPSHTHHDIFIHRDLESGFSPRTISDGLLEISWYFPAGREHSDIFPEPIAVANLRGNLESNLTQFSFLTQVSSAVLIFTESIEKEHYQWLSDCEPRNANFFFIICPPDGKQVNEETIDYLQKILHLLKINRSHCIVKEPMNNEADMVRQVQTLIRNLLKSSPKRIKLEDMADLAFEFRIHVDEDSDGFKIAKKRAQEITSEIKDVVLHKKNTMKLQGTPWKQMAKCEKEICRMRQQGDANGETYRSELKNQILTLRKEQSRQNLPGGIEKFLDALIELPHTDKLYFLKWMKFYLDSVSRKNLTGLKAEYSKKCNLSTNAEELKQLDQTIADTSLGIEHYLRELGQFYEAECFMVSNQEIAQRRFSKLPGIAADLLLDGFPLELIDGDASNIPLQWITDVLTELDTKTGGQCRMRVISVLGVQSTGKFTLLNTMFGLQFAVASGRCTRGAFMTLIKVKDNIQKELGCNFILVIDTEGLKAPELASLEDSYEHDNELATLVVGLSDITIINMSMENTTEMKDTLQIVVHAFLRMKEVGKKPNCQFVHQNVSDVSAYEKNMRDRRKLLEMLDEMTKSAAKMEKRDGITSFGDVMDYNPEEHVWYLPGLWQGVPPMAPINSGYAESIFALKKYLFALMKSKLQSQSPQNIGAFLGWMKSLWNAVKHEKFIFSFRNSLVADAYDQLSIKYSELEWNFRQKLYNWMIETGNMIRNQHSSGEQVDMMNALRVSMSQVLQEEERNMQGCLEAYFERRSENVHLVSRHREDFFKSVTSLKNELKNDLTERCLETDRIQKAKHQIQVMKESYATRIEDKVSSLLDSCRRKQQILADELKTEFETMWKNTVDGFQIHRLKKQDIDQAMLQLLKKEMNNKGGLINEKLLRIQRLSEFDQKTFIFEDKYTDQTWFQKCKDTIWYKASGYSAYYNHEVSYKINQLIEKLMAKCASYVSEKVNTKEDYHETFCQALLNMVNKELRQKEFSNLHTTVSLELEAKLLILGRATPCFQKMHDNFIKENNPWLCLESSKSQYFSIFKSIFHDKDECQNRAKRFCDLCLTPALIEYVENHLGKEIVNDILTNVNSLEYKSRTFFQYTVLRKLLEDNRFDQYVEYINKYEMFVKQWILNYIKDKYKEPRSLECLQLKLISFIISKVKENLRDPKTIESSNVSDFLKKFCDKLKKELVISQDDIKVIVFQNSAPVQQFSSDIDFFLSKTGDEIMSTMKDVDIESVLSKVTMKPEDELFKKVFGCGKQCPFCKVPCEAGAVDHREHFASIHRPQGLGRYRFVDTNVLCCTLCSTDVISNKSFRNVDTNGAFHPYKDYTAYYPDWSIQPDPTICASDYWKFIFKEFNTQFAKEYKANPAELPEDWYQITKEQALQNLKETFRMI
ncbi:up-regulator of cell proliferation-like [Pelobates fuscus]|uniref:up-regulator of cell proliferation-like n=1 Tax=Pelobates fuscus TaxID=191477 RepID=UPI002FE48877